MFLKKKFCIQWPCILIDQDQLSGERNGGQKKNKLKLKRKVPAYPKSTWPQPDHKSKVCQHGYDCRTCHFPKRTPPRWEISEPSTKELMLSLAQPLHFYYVSSPTLSQRLSIHCRESTTSSVSACWGEVFAIGKKKMAEWRQTRVFVFLGSAKGS